MEAKCRSNEEAQRKKRKRIRNGKSKKAIPKGNTMRKPNRKKIKPVAICLNAMNSR